MFHDLCFIICAISSALLITRIHSLSMFQRRQGVRLARRAPNYHSSAHYLCFSGGKSYVSHGARLADLLGLPWLSVTDSESFKSGGLVKANYHKVQLIIHVSSLS